jgi:protease-4
MAAITEQRQARRWRNGIRLAGWDFWWLLVWMGMDRGGSRPLTSMPHTALVKIKGEIASGCEASAELIVAAMRSAFEDKGAQAVVLLINSPGGSPVQAGIINDEILRLKALHNKPVYAVVEETCASAAYYIAVVPTRFLSTRPAWWAALVC